MMKNDFKSKVKSLWPAVTAGLLLIVLIGGIITISSNKSLDARDEEMNSESESPERGSAPENNEFQDPDRYSNGSGGSEAMLKRTIAQAESKKALCNDGTDYSYYYAPGAEGNEDKWVIYFQGGGACTSESACASRAIEDPDLITADRQASRISDGILSTDSGVNPDFHDWNHVFLPYCSSDTWSGTIQSNLNGETWNFYGHYIVEAVFDELLSMAGGNGLDDASEIMVVGSSAGGGGVQLNLDRIAEKINSESDSAPKIVGVLDSTWSFGVEPYSARVDAYGNVVDPEEGSQFHGIVTDESCEEANKDQLEVCITTETLLPYLSTPVFIYIDQRDSLKLARMGIDNLRDTEQREYWNTVYRPGLLASLEPLEGLFSPLAGKHTSLTSERFYSIEIEGLTFADVLGNWYFERAGVTRAVAERP